MNIQRKSDCSESCRERSEDWCCQSCEVHLEDSLPPDSEVEA